IVVTASCLKFLITWSSGISWDNLYTHSTVPVTMTSIIVKRVSNKEKRVFINSIVNKWYYIFNIVRVLKTTRQKRTCKLIFSKVKTIPPPPFSKGGVRGGLKLG